MAFALDTTSLQSVDLTTFSRVYASIFPGQDVEETTIQPHIEAVISDISEEITRYLGFHTLSAERSEVYEIARGKRVLTLDASPVTVSPTEIKAAVHESYLATATALPVTDYSIHKGAGWVKFHRRLGTDRVFVGLTYTGGLGTTAAEVIANHPEIAFAADLQCTYRWQRRDSLGGNITTLAGANTQFNAQYGLLREVKSILAAHRRVPA